MPSSLSMGGNHCSADIKIDEMGCLPLSDQSIADALAGKGLG